MTRETVTESSADRPPPRTESGARSATRSEGEAREIQRAGVGRTRVTAVGSCCRLRSIWFAKKGEWQGRST